MGEIPGPQFLPARLHPHPERESVLGDVAAGHVGVALCGNVRPQMVKALFPLLLVQRRGATGAAWTGRLEARVVESRYSFRGQRCAAGAERGPLVGDPAAEREPAIGAYPGARNVPVAMLRDVHTKVGQALVEPLLPHAAEGKEPLLHPVNCLRAGAAGLTTSCGWRLARVC